MRVITRTLGEFCAYGFGCRTRVRRRPVRMAREAVRIDVGGRHSDDAFTERLLLRTR
jgi:hypothetical protein